MKDILYLLREEATLSHDGKGNYTAKLFDKLVFINLDNTLHVGHDGTLYGWDNILDVVQVLDNLGMIGHVNMYQFLAFLNDTYGFDITIENNSVRMENITISGVLNQDITTQIIKLDDTYINRPNAYQLLRVLKTKGII